MSTYKRVAQWNIDGDKPNDNTTMKDIINQISRIEEEVLETAGAITEDDLLEVLDGICDIDVTICGLIYLLDISDVEDAITQATLKDQICVHNEYKLDDIGYINSVLFYMINEIDYVAHCIDNPEELDEDLEQFIYDAAYSLYLALVSLREYANFHFKYEDAITKVLDNNNEKFYVGNNIPLALERALELTKSTGEKHEVHSTVIESDVLDVNNPTSWELITGGIHSVHRVSDDKICKPLGFVGVDLSDCL